jgi:hypothetical protein
MLTIFFNGVSLITLNALASGAQFNQEYFIHNILPEIVGVRGGFLYGFRRSEFSAHGQFHDRNITGGLGLPMGNKDMLSPLQFRNFGINRRS